MSDDIWLSVREAARRAGVHENTIRNWVDSGLLPAKRVGKRDFRRVRPEDVDRLCAEQNARTRLDHLERRVDHLETVIKRLPAFRYWMSDHDA